jgi:hypothetical protein
MPSGSRSSGGSPADPADDHCQRALKRTDNRSIAEAVSAYLADTEEIDAAKLRQPDQFVHKG